jgi:hypothetical protein
LVEVQVQVAVKVHHSSWLEKLLSELVEEVEAETSGPDNGSQRLEGRPLS